MSAAGCPFCARFKAGEYDERSHRFDAMTFEPLDPVTPGHRLVMPVGHVRSVANHPAIAADVMSYAVLLASAGKYKMDEFNLITSVGAAATQSVQHMHLHLVPRREGDGLHLPWTGQKPWELRCSYCYCPLSGAPECSGGCAHKERSGMRGCAIEPLLEPVEQS